MSYGLNVPALFQRAAELLDKILRGTKPADIPVEQPTTFRLVVNLKTAKALGLTIPESFLLRADTVAGTKCESASSGLRLLTDELRNAFSRSFFISRWMIRCGQMR
jgi:putative ABC transport system substrate-binding protein